jgi:NADPH2:quinone reductase
MGVEGRMKKIIINNPGGPEVLKLVSSECPLADDHEVLIDVEAAGVNYGDVYQRSGVVETPKPFTPGYEGLGTVSAVGSEVESLRVGSRVAWISGSNSYAEQIALPAAQAIPIPDDFGVSEGLLFQAVTAQFLVSEYRIIQPGDVALVHSAAGGVGQILTQWLKHLGAIVIGTASTEQKLQTVLSLGADFVVNYAKSDFVQAVFELTSGRGVDIAFDAVGKDTFSSTVKALARRGIAVSYGMASGPAPAVDMLALTLRCSRVAGASIFEFIADPQEMQVRTAQVICGIQEGWLQMPSTTVYALNDAAAAHQAIESRSSQGKLALVPAK